MTTKIRIEARQAANGGLQILLRKPLLWIAISATWVIAVGGTMLAIPPSLWFVRFAVALGLLSPALVISLLSLYKFHGETSAKQDNLVQRLHLRDWIVVFLVELCMAGVFTALLALLLMPQLQFSVIVLYISAAIFGASSESNAIGLAIAAAVLMVPAFALMLGWLPAPLLAIRDKLGPIAALRRSWNTTYGSKLQLLIASLPFVLVISFAVVFFALARGIDGASGNRLSQIAIATLVAGGAIFWPWLLSTSMASCVMLENQRATEKSGAWFGAATAESASE